MGFPLASSGVAVACMFRPVPSESFGRVRVTDVAGVDDTLTAAVALFPSDRAVMITPPFARAVTSPWAETEAVDDADVSHVTVRPVSSRPLLSRSSATSCCRPPTASETLLGTMVTEYTGASTILTAAVAVVVPIFAVTCTSPSARVMSVPLPTS